MATNHFPPPYQVQHQEQSQAVTISPRQKIHVSNLPLSVTQHQLQQAFHHYGPIIDIRIIRKTQSGLPLNQSCYAFISFQRPESAEQAIRDGGIAEWTVKPQIDRTMIRNGNHRSRSRSRSNERQKRVLTGGSMVEVEFSEKIQVQMQVRELFVTGITKPFDENRVREIDNAQLALQNCHHIVTHFPMPIKISFSDPIKRHNILGNNPQYEKPQNLTAILFIFFPPHQEKHVDFAYLLQILKREKCAPLRWNYVQPDPQQKSYALLEFQTTNSALKMRSFFQSNIINILGDSKCEVGIISTTDYDKNIKKMPPGLHYLNQQPPYEPLRMPHQPSFLHQIQMQPAMQQSIQQTIQPPMSMTMSMQPKMQPSLTQQMQPPPIFYQFQPQFYPPPQQQLNQYQSQIPQRMPIIDDLQNHSQYQYEKNQKHSLTKDENIFWTGAMYRSNSHKVLIDAKSKYKLNIQMQAQIQVNFKANFQDALKIQKEAVYFVLSPADSRQIGAFEEYIKYFLDKNKIGVANIPSGNLYIMPPHQLTNQIHPLQGNELLALYQQKPQNSQL